MPIMGDFVSRRRLIRKRSLRACATPTRAWSWRMAFLNENHLGRQSGLAPQCVRSRPHAFFRAAVLATRTSLGDRRVGFSGARPRRMRSTCRRPGGLRPSVSHQMAPVSASREPKTPGARSCSKLCARRPPHETRRWRSRAGRAWSRAAGRGRLPRRGRTRPSSGKLLASEITSLGKAEKRVL